MAKKIKKTDKKEAAADKGKRAPRRHYTTTGNGKKKVQQKKTTTTAAPPPVATEPQMKGPDPTPTHEQPQQQQGTTTQAPPPPGDQRKPYERPSFAHSNENLGYTAPEYFMHIDKMKAEKKAAQKPITTSRFGGWTISPIAPSLWMLAGAGYGALDHLNKNKGYDIDRRRLKLEMLFGMLWGFALGILFGVKIEYFPSGCNSCGNRMISIPEYLWIRLIGDSSEKEAAKK